MFFENKMYFKCFESKCIFVSIEPIVTYHDQGEYLVGKKLAFRNMVKTTKKHCECKINNNINHIFSQLRQIIFLSH